MPNYASNRLTTAGEPEDVAEFSIFCAQSIAPYRASLRQSVSNASVVMNKRFSPDLSFWTIACENDIKEDGGIAHSWGTKWDAFGEINQTESTPGDRDPHYHDKLKAPYLMDFDVRFSTAWAAPTGFLQRASARFDSLVLFLSYDDSEDSIYSLTRACDGCCNTAVIFDNDEPDQGESDDDLYEVMKAAWHIEKDEYINAQHDAAVSAAMPEGRAFHPLIQKIISDDAAAVRTWLETHPDDANACLDGKWPALHHAAFSGSAKVFNELMAFGADPNQKTNRSTFGLMDILLDIRGTEDEPRLATQKQMFAQLIAESPAMLRKPLCTSILPIEMIARWGMREHLILALPHINMTESSPVGSAIHTFHRQSDLEDLRAAANPYRKDGVEFPLWIKLLSVYANAQACVAFLSNLSVHAPEAVAPIASLMLTDATFIFPRQEGLDDQNLIEFSAEILSNLKNCGANQAFTQSLFDAIFDRLAQIPGLNDGECKIEDDERVKIQRIQDLLRSASVRMEATQLIAEIESGSGSKLNTTPKN